MTSFFLILYFIIFYALLSCCISFCLHLFFSYRFYIHLLLFPFFCQLSPFHPFIFQKLFHLIQTYPAFLHISLLSFYTLISSLLPDLLFFSFISLFPFIFSYSILFSILFLFYSSSIPTLPIFHFNSMPNQILFLLYSILFCSYSMLILFPLYSLFYFAIPCRLYFYSIRFYWIKTHLPPLGLAELPSGIMCSVHPIYFYDARLFKFLV